MSAFRDALGKANKGRSGHERQWIFVPYDQLTDRVGPLAMSPPAELGIVVVETLWKPRQRRYHKQKLALVLASLRHFALEQARRGVAVRHVFGEESYRELLEPVIAELGPLRMMEAAEYELRRDLQPLVDAGKLEICANETWLTKVEQFEESLPPGKPWRMDAFYRRVRRDSGILMTKGKPVGGKFSFDADNRKRWRGDPPAPALPRFPVDAIKKEVGALVEEHFQSHPGKLELKQLPATRKDADRAWRWALEECMEHFGPFEDAMSVESQNLFHTRISALLNNGRLLPARVVEDVAALDIPLPSKEGFIRQVLGWREFMRHVHYQTDGFRRLPDGHQANALDGNEALPAAFWGEASGLHCLDRVVDDVWATGYGHHITRLMVLSNLATLLGIDARELSDWFWVAYIDAYDWVVEPNVLGMGTFSLGDLFVTKPYVSGAAYIHKMSDYCGSCAFDPKKTCPITPLYWDFMARNRKALDGNPRVAMPLRSLAKRSAAQKKHAERVRKWVQRGLADGKRLVPGERPD